MARSAVELAQRSKDDEDEGPRPRSVEEEPIASAMTGRRSLVLSVVFLDSSGNTTDEPGILKGTSNVRLDALAEWQEKATARILSAIGVSKWAIGGPRQKYLGRVA